MRRSRSLRLHYSFVSRRSHFHGRTVAARIAPMTRSGLEPLPLAALIANEYLRLDRWSDHVSSIVFSLGKSLFVWREPFDRSVPAEKQESNSLKEAASSIRPPLEHGIRSLATSNRFIFIESFKPDHTGRAVSHQSSYGRDRCRRSDRMGCSNRFAEEFRPGHDRDESVHCGGPARGEHRFVSAPTPRRPERAQHCWTTPRRHHHRDGWIESPPLQ